METVVGCAAICVVSTLNRTRHEEGFEVLLSPVESQGVDWVEVTVVWQQGRAPCTNLVANSALISAPLPWSLSRHSVLRKLAVWFRSFILHALPRYTDEHNITRRDFPATMINYTRSWPVHMVPHRLLLTGITRHPLIVTGD